MERRFSEQEARQIFALAAEREQAAQSLPDAALSLAELQEAARAAGIDPAFVRAAVADFLHADGQPVRRTVAGLPVELRRTRLIPGVLDDDAWAGIVGACRRIFGRHGVATDLGQTREWASEADERKMPVRVTVEQEADGLRVTIGRKSWPQALGLGVATGINLVVGLVLGVVWAVGAAPNDLWVPAFILTLFALLFGAGAYAGLRVNERRDVRRFADAFAAVEHLTGSTPTDERLTAPDEPARLPLDEAGPSPLADAERGTPRRTRA